MNFYYNKFVEITSLFASWLGAWGVASITIGTMVLVFFFKSYIKDKLWSLLMWRIEYAYKFSIAAVLSSFFRMCVSFIVDFYNLFIVFTNDQPSSYVIIDNPPVPFLWLILTVIFSILSFFWYDFAVSLYVKVEDWAANNFFTSILMLFRSQLFIRGVDRSSSFWSIEFLEYFFFSFMEVVIFIFIPLYLLYFKTFITLAYLIIFINLLMFSLIFNYDTKGDYTDNYLAIFNYVPIFFNNAKTSKISKKLPIFNETLYDQNGNVVSTESEFVQCEFTVNNENYSMNELLPVKHGDKCPDIAMSLISDIVKVAAYKGDVYNNFYKAMRVYTYLNNDSFFKYSNKLNKRFFYTTNVIHSPREQVFKQVVIETISGGKKVVSTVETKFHSTRSENLVEEINYLNQYKFKSLFLAAAGASLAVASYELDELSKSRDRASHERIASIKTEGEVAKTKIKADAAVEIQKQKTRQMEIQKSIKEMEQTRSLFSFVFGSSKPKQ